MTSILIIDDELSMREFLKILLDKEGYKISTAADAHRALQLMETHDFDLAISDIRMPGMSGITLLSEAARRQPDAAFCNPEWAATRTLSRCLELSQIPVGR